MLPGSNLRNNEERFLKAFQNDTVGVLFIDMECNFLEANDAFLRMAGYNRDALEQGELNPGRMTLPEWMPRTWQAFTELKETGLISPYEKQLVRPDGTRWWGLFTGTRLGENEAVEYVIDITTRKRAEEAHGQCELNYRRLFESIDEGFCIFEMLYDHTGRPVDYRFIEVNPAFEKNTGLAGVVGKTIRELVPEHETYWFDIYGKVVSTGKPIRFENPGKGLHRWFSVYAFRMGRREDRKVAAIFSDITKRRRAEEALQESEEKFRLMANNISQLAWMGDSRGNIFWYNKRCFDFTGLTPREMEGLGWRNLVHPEHLERVQKNLKNAWKKGEALEDLVPIKDKNAQYRWFLSCSIPVKDEKKNIIRWFGTATDVTKQIETEEMLKKDYELIENLLYIAAHDLKGPVANMQQAINLMNHLDTKRKLELFERFQGLTDQLDKTIRGVTDILRVRNTDESSAKRIHFETILHEILHEFGEEFRNSTIKFNFSKKYIYYIEPFLQSILKNLIGNSIKYCREDVPLKVEIITGRNGEYVLLSVHDNGAGIDLSRHGEKIFTPFQRFNAGNAIGTGIGLYLVKNIIEKNGGYIKAESTPGNGATFHCYLKEY